MRDQEWLLFLSQLPASPSSPRVTVWRRIRSAGAAGLQNGVWILPRAAEQEQFLEELLDYVKRQQGSGQIFVVRPLNPAVQSDLIQRFHSDRDQEYAELREQCTKFREEIEKETQNQKYTFAELEENEQNLDRLEVWLLKIQKRDFFGSRLATTAVSDLEACRQALKMFAIQVYTHEGFEPAGENQGSEDQENSERDR